MMNSKSMWTALLCGLVLATSASIGRAQGLVEYALIVTDGEFREISTYQDLDDDFMELPAAVSNNGVVVGGQVKLNPNSTVGERAFSYDYSSNQLGVLPRPASMDPSRAMMAWDVTADGLWAFGEGRTVDNKLHAAVWGMPVGAPPTAGDLHAPGSALDQAYDESVIYGVAEDALASDGHAVGFGVSSNGVGEAIWIDETGTIVAPATPAAGEVTVFKGISDGGLVSAGMRINPAAGNSTPIRYEADTNTVTELVEMNPAGASGTLVTDLSADGDMIIGVSDSNLNGINREAFGWTESEGMFGLGVLPNQNWSQAWSVGEMAGQKMVAGVSGYDASGSPPQLPLPANEFAFLWMEDAAVVDGTTQDFMYPLVSILTELGVDYDGWHLSRATAISPNGRYVAGTGTDASGNPGTWVVELVPEPATMCFLAMGAVAVLSRRARRCQA